VRGRGSIWFWLAVAVAVMAGGGIAGAAILHGSSGSHPRSASADTSMPIPTTIAAPVVTGPPTTTRPPTTTTTVPASTSTTAPDATRGPVVVLAGCPVPPHAPLPPSPPPWHPATLVTNLPAISPPSPWTSRLGAITGKGMWVWEWNNTDQGNAGQVVSQALAKGLHQLWVRVGDSKDGFYGQTELDALVPVAHARGLAVIAWGFPYLWDPSGDAHWTAQILNWRGPGGQQVDGFSADIEKPTEGVQLSAQRAAVYLEQVRKSAGDRLIVATVYPPSDANWNGGYPYKAMAPYVDAFAPMVYWECADPGAEAALDVARLAKLRPVHIIGQAFNFASVGGRTASPSAAEISEFMTAGRRAGALGASFWVWQEATAQEWAALTNFRWAAS
jgi:hypothetical protein